MRYLMSCAALVAAAFLCAWPAVAERRTFSVEDLVRMEELGRTLVSPQGDRVAFEVYGPWSDATRFDLGPRSNFTVGRITLMSIEGKEPKTLLADQPPGQVLGDWSLSGRFLSLYGFRNGAWELGVYDTRTDQVHWSGLSPELSFEGARPAWLGDDRLIVPVRPGRASAWSLRHDAFAREDTEARWRERDAGRLSATALESRAGVATPKAALPIVSLRVLDPMSAQSTELASGPIHDFAVSASGRYLALMERGEGVAADEPLVQLAATFRGRLRILDLTTGVDWSIGATRDVASGLLGWSTSQDRLLVWARNDGQSWRDGDLYVVDPAAKAVTPQLRGRLDPVGKQDLDLMNPVRATWMGDRPIVYAAEPGADRRDWRLVDEGGAVLTAQVPDPPSRLLAVTDRHILMLADGGVWRAGLEQDARRLTDPEWRLLSRTADDIYLPMRQQLNLYAARDWAAVFDAQGQGLIVSVDGKVQSLKSSGGGAAAWAAGVSDRALVQRRTVDGVTRLGLETVYGSTVLATVNATLAERAFPEMVDVPHADRNGEAAVSRLYMPPGLSVDRIKGVVVAEYPGSAGRSWLYEPGVLLEGLNPNLFAAAGYAVLWAAMPDAPPADRAEAFAANLDLALAAAGTAVPGLPITRTAVIGHSFGGYAALMVASATRRHRAYVSWAGPSDLAVMWGEFQGTERAALSDNLYLLYRSGWAETRQGGFGAPPWAAKPLYEAANAFLRSDRIEDPVLLIGSDRDVVPLSAGEMMFSALHRQGKPVRLVTYWGEGHWNYSPANMVDVYREIIDWIDHAMALEVSGDATEKAPPAKPRAGSANASTSSRPSPPT
jgi:dipeptidyl aminopeptidase/acylaminoacyl peptidase